MTTDATPLPDPNRPLAAQGILTLLAMCIFGEARGESDLAQRAVAKILINRARFPHPVFGSKKGARFEENLRAAILQPQQFSSLNQSDPNYAKLLRPLDYETAATWQRCLRCAELAIASRDSSDTLTLNSDHYFDDSIQPPSWAHPTQQTVKIGSFRFYRLYLPPFGVRSGASASESDVNAKARAASAPPARPQGTPIQAASKTASGSCLHATGSNERGPCARASRAALAPENSPLRPLVSLLAPKSPSAQLCGPRPYLPYEWSGRLSLLFTALGLCLFLAGCSDFERAAYNVLAVTQVEYETVQAHMAEAAVHGLIDETQWNRFQSEGHKFIAAHNSTVDAFAIWSAAKSNENTARLQAMLDNLPKLIREINDLVRSFSEQPPQLSKDGNTDPASI